MKLTIHNEASVPEAEKPASGRKEVSPLRRLLASLSPRSRVSTLRRVVRQPARLFRVSGAVVSAAPACDSSTQLFRTEALTEYQTHWLGTVLLTPRRTDHLFAIGAIVA